MSRKGGYKIIDLKNYDFESTMEIKGIYEEIESNYNKPLLFTGIVIKGIEKNDTFANVVVNGDGYDVVLYGKKYHINNLDIVTIERVSPITLQSSDTLECKLGDEYVVEFTGYSSSGVYVKIPQNEFTNAVIRYTTLFKENPGDVYTMGGITINKDNIENKYVLGVTHTASITKLN